MKEQVELEVPNLKDLSLLLSYRVWFGLVWFGLVWYGLVWFGMVWYGLVGFGMNRFGMVWFGMVSYGLVWFGMVWYGLVCKYFGDHLFIYVMALQGGVILRRAAITTQSK